MGIELFKSHCLSLPETVEAAHFENLAYKVNKKIYATLNEKESRATVKLNAIDQDVFCRISKGCIFPVPNKWGKHGWTHLNLGTIPTELAKDAINSAYCNVAPKGLSDKISADDQ